MQEFVAEEWKHSKCRSPKDGYPRWDGRKWECSRCELSMYLNHKVDSSLEEGIEFFWEYLAWVSYVRIDGTLAPQRGVSEEQQEADSAIYKLGYELLRNNGHKGLLDMALCREVGKAGDYELAKKICAESKYLSQFFTY